MNGAVSLRSGVFIAHCGVFFTRSGVVQRGATRSGATRSEALFRNDFALQMGRKTVFDCLFESAGCGEGKVVKANVTVES